MLPGKNGKTICKELRSRQYGGPIMMLTALDEEVDQIVGLEIGADDYITKPVRPRFLLSRIKAILRLTARTCAHSSKKRPSSLATNKSDSIHIGALTIHIPSRTIFMNRRPKP